MNQTNISPKLINVNMKWISKEISSIKYKSKKTKYLNLVNNLNTN